MMNRNLLSLLLIMLAVAPGAVTAADAEPITDTVPPPPVLQSGDAIEAEVTIRQDG